MQTGSLTLSVGMLFQQTDSLTLFVGHVVS